MSSFWWTGGHLGWAAFALILFTGVWWLLADLYWRLVTMRASRLAIMIGIGWLIGVGLILLGYQFGSR